jgi:hypothetical protein
MSRRQRADIEDQMHQHLARSVGHDVMSRAVEFDELFRGGAVEWRDPRNWHRPSPSNRAPPWIDPPFRRSPQDATCSSTASALGEQIGWSGFLSPRLAERYGFTRAAFITGAVWATWHFPTLFFADYDSASPVWLPCFVIELLGLSVIMLWLRLRSGSVWTGALVPASINLWNQEFFTPLTAPRGAITNYTIDESGFMLPIVISITAYLFWRQRAAVLPAERVSA